ncbi:hypothetical protein [Gordonibacter urolithinfaciens]|jgi:hypothetical protein|uniref:Uncharacterized protein n=1 Tax=Gordonibacter urolithinfaciens TaxID=1335613 RepID=A0A7K0I727_9ACTN|nr:hypothetical protein [Gordonibacter urolithinfaciens]MBS6974417.1 hypothetical protein [Eggerthellaceae bacterium]MCB6560453.1 hypothetical protein [Gordonibacter urolithinfaciens]MCB7086020.1 hypothetical protein [Gordonibacter urolithinfaciens]MSA93596.1 hypothetical protein [Gordonibacter urolithinfaciens]
MKQTRKASNHEVTDEKRTRLFEKKRSVGGLGGVHSIGHRYIVFKTENSRLSAMNAAKIKKVMLFICKFCQFKLSRLRFLRHRTSPHILARKGAGNSVYNQKRALIATAFPCPRYDPSGYIA